MENYFMAEIWPEDQVPEALKNCNLCELSKQGKRMIWGEGNPKADIIVILDNPGLREDKYGNEFVCGTRQMLQEAAYIAGLNKTDLYITYILKCRPIRSYNKDTARGTCIGYLEQQLKKNDYKIAFCLGDTAVKAFFTDPERNVKMTRGSWNIVKGLPTYVSYHPLAVRRRPNLFKNFINDWEAVARALKEQKVFINL